MLFAGIDPSVRFAAWAVYDDTAKRVIRVGKGDIWDILDVYPTYAIEVPKIYVGKTPNPNDIITLALYCGQVICHVERILRRPITRFFPQDWKGQLTKQETERRISKRQPETVPMVAALTGKVDDVWDAIGIAMHLGNASLLNRF